MIAGKFASWMFRLVHGTGVGKHPLMSKLFFLYASTFGFYTEVEGMKIKAAVYYKPKKFVLYHTENHEPHVRRIFCSLVRKGMTIIDVGAAVGLYTVLTARRVGDRGQVYSFEPDPVHSENLSQIGQSTDAIQGLLEKFGYDIYLLPRREYYLLIKKMMIMPRLKKVLRGVCVEAAKCFHPRPSRRALILYYHGIDERVGNRYYLKIPPDTFKEQMRLLKDNYRVISLSEFIKKVKKGSNIENCVVITFDDGFKDNYTVAYPLLYKYDLPATFFITTDFVGRKGYMSWEDLKELRDSEFEIGSHTVTHPRLSELPMSRVEEELKVSRNVLEDRLENKITLFAAPYGDSKSVNDEVINAIKKYYECCCLTQGFFGIDPDNVDVYHLKRTPAMPDLSEFELTVDGYAGLWLWLYEKLIILKNEKLGLARI